MAPSSQSHALGLRNFSFASTASTSPAGYPYLQRTQGLTSEDLALLAEQFGQQNGHATMSWVSQQQSQGTSLNAVPSEHELPDSAVTNCPTQQQVNTISQCQLSHALQLSSLLEEMIAARGQCSACIAEQANVAHTPVWEEDEALGGMEEEDGDLDRPMLTYRRSTDLSSQQGYVNKTIRVRKRRGGEGSS
ncbi:hypothetical protein FKW77_000862 [Venturia effusa]|uniref:Uncharacterized protein n=1 Tax=Venturia effusa TaxID=50376 RepID=A0A517L4U9_9PEZI|nr:hypothetical protein FKW77_000862 [Venturia effusa]